jgi:hypothetical protein
MFLTLSTILFLYLSSLYNLILCTLMTQHQEKVLVTPNEQLQNGGWHNVMMSLKVCDGGFTQVTNILHIIYCTSYTAHLILHIITVWLQVTNILHIITVWLQEHKISEDAYILHIITVWLQEHKISEDAYILYIITVWLQEHKISEDAYVFIIRYKH